MPLLLRSQTAGTAARIAHVEPGVSGVSEFAARWGAAAFFAGRSGTRARFSARSAVIRSGVTRSARARARLARACLAPAAVADAFPRLASTARTGRAVLLGGVTASAAHLIAGPRFVTLVNGITSERWT